MSEAVDARLRRLLGGPELAVVRQRLRRHFERHDDAGSALLRLDRLDPAAHSALAQLTGQPARLARSMALDIGDLDRRLREAGLARSLRDALERLEGPIAPLARLRRETAAQWQRVFAAATADPRLDAWLALPAAPGLLKRLAGSPEAATALLDAASRVLGRLPAAGLTRSRLAAETLGDAHALDAGRAAATLVLAAWRQYETSTDGDVAALDAEERQRDVWARAGVLVNELARPALFLNLPGAAPCWLPGEPAYLSRRHLLNRAPQWKVSGRRVFVCENPSMVAIAADALGASSPPLVSTDGMPSAAQRSLLDQLVAAGARLAYHGDFDWPGIAIGNFVMRRWNAAPWRFGASDYRAAVAVAAAPPRAAGVGEAVVAAAWDDQLALAMQQHGIAIAEEAVADALLQDLD
jgi:uncharacterized protein (TIGR02679 family)